MHNRSWVCQVGLDLKVSLDIRLLCILPLMWLRRLERYMGGKCLPNMTQSTVYDLHGVCGQDSGNVLGVLKAMCPQARSIETKHVPRIFEICKIARLSVFRSCVPTFAACQDEQLHSQAFEVGLS